jgi:hypothetical protein
MMPREPRIAPPCFSNVVDYHEWRYLNTKAGTSATYCADCTPGYKTKMMFAGRCRWPLTTFVTMRGGDLVGVRKFKQGGA